MPSSARSAPTAIYTLSLHDALPIFYDVLGSKEDDIFHGIVVHLGRLGHRVLVLADDVSLITRSRVDVALSSAELHALPEHAEEHTLDRKSTRLNSSHTVISYAVFCSVGAHRDLHSFPTRRSSDLLRRAGLERGRHLPRHRRPPGPAGASRAGPCRRRQPHHSIARGCGPLLGGAPCPAGTRRGAHLRSEEHTSELQSHSDLVCRLLLGRRPPRSTLFPYTTLFRSSTTCWARKRTTSSTASSSTWAGWGIACWSLPTTSASSLDRAWMWPSPRRSSMPCRNTPRSTP